MERFSSLEIQKPDYPTLSAIFTYDDNFIDAGLRLYDLKQSLHLYLKRNGYTTIVFYNTANGYSSYEKDMLVRFLTEIKETPDNDRPQVQEHIVLNPEQVGSRSGSRLGARLKKKVAGANLTPDTPVAVDAPEMNLWFESNSQRWHRKTVGDRIANMDQIIYNLPLRRHMAIVVDASEQEVEFSTGVEKLVDVIRTTQQNARINTSNINDNRLIVLINAESCRLQLMRLFFDEQGNKVPHTSIFMNNFFRNHLLHLPKDRNHYILNFKNAFPIGQPTKEDVKRILLRARIDSGVEKNVDWVELDDICEQISFQDKWKLTDLYLYLMEKRDYTYNSFDEKVDGIKKRGNAEGNLHTLIGLNGVKEQIEAIKRRIRLSLERGENIDKINKHMLFLGNPGTGKTTVARIIGEIYKDLGLVKKGHVVEVTREHLVAEYVGQTAIKTQKVVDSAIDGILFVDEAYRLARGGENDFGVEAVDTILARMENDRDRLVVIFAGYEEDMKDLFKMNTGLDSRFKYKIFFEDYTAAELKQIFKLLAVKRYTITPEVDALLDRIMVYALGYKSRSNDKDYKFGNARWVRNLFELVENNVANRMGESDTTILLTSDFSHTSLKELKGFSINVETQEETKSNLDVLMEMIGLEEVKQEVNSLICTANSFVQYRNAGIETTVKPSMHLVFSGNPGTGKTTVARLMGQIYYELGLLTKGHVVEIENRGQLVAAYQGHTAIRVNEIVDSARGGVLFIDEIYSLVSGSNDTFGIEALNTLLTRIENERDDMVVILAGYKELMASFLRNNQGMESRFNKYINFADYSADELFCIVESFLLGKKKEFVLVDAASRALKDYIAERRPVMSVTSGNGRWARNLAEHIQTAHSIRISKIKGASKEELLTYTCDDISTGIERLNTYRLQ